LPPITLPFVASRKKWDVANYASIALISEIILRSSVEINFNGLSFVTNNRMRDIISSLLDGINIDRILMRKI
jgi:hypothetical protein